MSQGLRKSACADAGAALPLLKCVPAELTFVDFVWADLLEQMAALAPGCLDSAPAARAACDAVAALPAVAAYRASAQFIDRPYNNPMAVFK